jgi:tellurite resistance protein
MLASSGCDCAEAADLITELTEALREVIGEVKKTDRRAEKAVRKAVAILAKAGGPINE